MYLGYVFYLYVAVILAKENKNCQLVSLCNPNMDLKIPFLCAVIVTKVFY